MCRYNDGILWKIKKEKAMGRENNADIIRGSLNPPNYRQLVMTFIPKGFKLYDFMETTP
jgi:hypothetical protein